MADRYEDRYRTDDHRRERGYGPGRDPGRDDRGFLDRASDEVRSWFGDDDADRRRRMDEARYGRDYNRYGRDAERYGGERPVGRDWDRYGRDWDYGHHMGFDYGRGGRDWPGREAAFGERSRSDSAPIDYGRPGWAAYGDEAGYGSRDRYLGGTPDRSAYRGRFGSGGTFAGRGPRGYQRSDDRIREDVCDRLSEDPWIDAGDVEVTVRGGEVTLSGTVRDRADKRRAEDILENVSGVREVHNNLRVGSAWESSPGREHATPREPGTTREQAAAREQPTTSGSMAGTSSRR